MKFLLLFINLLVGFSASGAGNILVSHHYEVGNVTQLIESSTSTVNSGGTMTTINLYNKVYRLLTETRTDTGTSSTEVKATTYEPRSPRPHFVTVRLPPCHTTPLTHTH